MPRFVLLRHEFPAEFGKPSHWDVMLEDGEALLTWSCEELPVAGGDAVVATRLGNHRLAYLEYEGLVSGGRGEVRRVDGGEFVWIQRSEARFTVEVRGGVLAGTLVIEERDGATHLQRMTQNSDGERGA
jgi:hypothetical protein